MELIQSKTFKLTFFRRMHAEFIFRTFSLNILSANDFHTVMIAVVDDMLTLSFESTAMPVLVLITACIEYLVCQQDTPYKRQ